MPLLLPAGRPYRSPAPTAAAAKISAGDSDPGGRRSAAARLASRCSASLTGVGTPCSRPSRTISPFRKSASIDPVPRVSDCHDEPPPARGSRDRGVVHVTAAGLAHLGGGRVADARRRRGPRRPRPWLARSARGQRPPGRRPCPPRARTHSASIALPRLPSSLRYFQRITSGVHRREEPAARQVGGDPLDGLIGSGRVAADPAAGRPSAGRSAATSPGAKCAAGSQTHIP